MLKSDIRIEFKEKRKSLSSQEKVNESRKIAELVKSNFKLEDKIVSIFLPIERFNEVNTVFLIEQLQNVNSTISTPITDLQNLTLKHLIFNDKTILKNNNWGIPEPVNGDEINPETFDIVFVPLLATNKTGYRVGYGKGFYDRFLSLCRDETIFIGLNYFENLIEIDDLNKNDIPIHFLVTPNKILKF
jgi:5-formyltetrahydrofolate cyclo-ligase